MRYPILIFDEVWLSRFPKEEKNHKILRLENELKDMVKEEAKITGINKKLKLLKNKYLQEILSLSDQVNLYDKKSTLKMDALRKKVIRINREISKNESLLLDFPKEIQKINSELMEETINVCYNLMEKFQAEINELEPKIDGLSQKLNFLVEKRHNVKDNYNKVLKLLNALVGPEAMDILDKK
ncbi:MAG: hypothetical protein LBV08_02285 [Clostridiales bacterium]|jgi:chromosome segregation ATPase|nr:hypothetical protein [Clostridiales bacterium]